MAVLIMWVMAIAMITTITVGASGTGVIAAEIKVLNGNIHTVKNVNARIQKHPRHQSPNQRQRRPSAVPSAHSLTTKKMAVVTTITIFAVAVGTVGIVVAPLVIRINGFTVQNVSVWTLIMMLLDALAPAVPRIGWAMATAMMTTITAGANGMGVTAVA